MKYLFGPVPSRRLGFSLGIDLTPYKTCTLDCTYCQLGRTTNLTLNRKKRVFSQDVLKEIELKLKDNFDCLTLAGSGEPTLHEGIDEIVRGAKELTDKPLVLLTNGTLFYDPEVRREVYEADIIMPSLDAAEQSTFQKINRPHPDLRIDKVIEGLVALRREFDGQMWLEVMLVKGFNDHELKSIASAANRIGPDRIQLNTVVRPPTDPVQPLSPAEMDDALCYFQDAEVIANWGRSSFEDYDVQIYNLLSRRPCTLDDMVRLTKLHRNEVLKYLEVMEGDKLIIRQQHGENIYFKAYEKPIK